MDRQTRQQFDMCYHAMSGPTQRWTALLEIQNSGNPLTDAELRAFAIRQPQFADVVNAYLNGSNR